MSGEIRKTAEPGVFSFEIPPDWEAVKAAWDPSRLSLVQGGVGPDEAYQVAMVAQELLENAVKYGAFGPDERIALEIRITPEEITVEVRSRVGVDDAHLRRFDQMIQWIRGYQDPFEAYVERMKLVSTRPYSDGESGLGLARIAYEGRSIIDFYVNEENVLAVSAVHRREAEGPWPRP